MAASRGFSCTKCGTPQFEADEIRTTGKIFRFLNIQHKKFTDIVAPIAATLISIKATPPNWPTRWTSWQANHDRGRIT